MTAEPLPKAAEAGYLTDALRRSGALGDGRVREVVVESSRPTILSRIDRLCVSYEGDAGGAPGSLILKTGSPERARPEWNAGRQEVAFYEEVGRLSRLVPRCFDAKWDADTNEWHLLLEDLTDSHFSLGNWPLPPIFEQAERIVAVRARFHAEWWDDPRLGVSVGSWAPAGDGLLRAFAAKVAEFGERVGERLSPERRDVYQRLIDAAPRLNARYRTRRNMTIVHGDAHVWNVFLPQAEGSDDIRLFDWDSWRIGAGTQDLAYMMALHWYPDHRRSSERRLLDRYHAGLLAHGVAGYDRRALDDDYRLSALWQISTPVWQASAGIPAWIWWPHVERIFMAIDDLGCRELLEG